MLTSLLKNKLSNGSMVDGNIALAGLNPLEFMELLSDNDLVQHFEQAGLGILKACNNFQKARDLALTEFRLKYSQLIQDHPKLLKVILQNLILGYNKAISSKDDLSQSELRSRINLCTQFVSGLNFVLNLNYSLLKKNIPEYNEVFFKVHTQLLRYYIATKQDCLALLNSPEKDDKNNHFAHYLQMCKNNTQYVKEIESSLTPYLSAAFFIKKYPDIESRPKAPKSYYKLLKESDDLVQNFNFELYNLNMSFLINVINSASVLALSGHQEDAMCELSLAKEKLHYFRENSEILLRYTTADLTFLNSQLDRRAQEIEAILLEIKDESPWKKCFQKIEYFGLWNGFGHERLRKFKITNTITSNMLPPELDADFTNIETSFNNALKLLQTYYHSHHLPHLQEAYKVCIYWSVFFARLPEQNCASKLCQASLHRIKQQIENKRKELTPSKDKSKPIKTASSQPLASSLDSGLDSSLSSDSESSVSPGESDSSMTSSTNSRAKPEQAKSKKRNRRRRNKKRTGQNTAIPPSKPLSESSGSAAKTDTNEEHVIADLTELDSIISKPNTTPEPILLDENSSDKLSSSSSTSSEDTPDLSVTSTSSTQSALESTPKVDTLEKEQKSKASLETDALKFQIKELTHQAQELEVKVALLTKKRAESESQKRQLSEEISDLQKQKASASSAYKTQKATYQKNIRTYSEQHDAMLAFHKDALKDKQDVTREISELSEKVDASNLRLKENQARLDRILHQEEQVQRRLQQHKQQSKALYQEFVKTKSALKELHSKISQAKLNLAELQSQIEDQQNSLDDLVKQVSIKQVKVDDLEVQIGEKQETLDELSKQIEKLSLAQAKFLKNTEEAKAQCQAEERALKKFKAQKSLLTDEIEVLTEDLAKLRLGANQASIADKKDSSPSSDSADSLRMDSLKIEGIGIKLPEHVVELMKKIESKGFFALVKGGLIRDLLNGKAYYDADLVTNCPFAELVDLDLRLGTTFFSDQFCIPGGVDECPIEITLLSPFDLKTDSASSYLAEEALYANYQGELFDPKGLWKYIDTKTMGCVPDIDLYFAKDPSRMLRCIYSCNHTQKKPNPTTINAFEAVGYRLSQIQMSVLLPRIESLFLRGESFVNFSTLYQFGFIPHMLPTLGLSCYSYYPQYSNVLGRFFEDVDLNRVKKPSSAYEVIAILLYPLYNKILSEQEFDHEAAVKILLTRMQTTFSGMEIKHEKAFESMFAKGYPEISEQIHHYFSSAQAKERSGSIGTSRTKSHSSHLPASNSSTESAQTSYLPGYTATQASESKQKKDNSRRKKRNPKNVK